MKETCEVKKNRLRPPQVNYPKEISGIFVSTQTFAGFTWGGFYIKEGLCLKPARVAIFTRIG
jgi:hypothetical protein